MKSKNQNEQIPSNEGRAAETNHTQHQWDENSLDAIRESVGCLESFILEGINPTRTMEVLSINIKEKNEKISGVLGKQEATAYNHLLVKMELDNISTMAFLMAFLSNVSDEIRLLKSHIEWADQKQNEKGGVPC